uniref:RRM domain-containing protein n=1 Tax=Elaeophora elaphi TaxID=1147741 RepID=A0A158Q6X3_9BILA
MTAEGDFTKLKPTDLHLPHMGTSEERTLYVQNVPETWDKWKLLHIFRRFGRIDNIKIVKKHDDSLTSAFVHMMSIADANSVINATAHDNGKIQLPELSKPLKACLIQFVRQKWNANLKTELTKPVDREAERVKSYFSIVGRSELVLAGLNIRKPIIYNERFHRHMYLAAEELVEVELVKPITEFRYWPMTFYVLTKTHVCEAENLIISNEDLNSHLVAHFERAAEVTYVVKNELLIAKPKTPNELPLRCRVLEELDGRKIRIYALDVGQTLVVQMSELKVISEYLTSIPARATPCTLYGITEPTPAFAEVACRLLENIDHLVVSAVTFEGAIAVVRAFKSNGSSINEIAEILSNEGVCNYKPPTKRQVYSRELIMSLKEREGQLSILNHEVADAILVSRRLEQDETVQLDENLIA